MPSGIGSTIQGGHTMANSAEDYPGQAFFQDIGDFLGLGSARRQRDFEANQAEIDRLWQEQENQKAREYQTWFASNAHQMEVQDLKAAGLNPALAAGGTGAAAPGGVTSSGAMAHGVAGQGNGLQQITTLINAATNYANAKRNAVTSATKQANKSTDTGAVSTIAKLAKLLK